MISLMAGAESIATRAVRLDAIIGRVQLVFRRAIALAFKSEDGKRISIAFAIDGRSADAHEIEYARSADNQKSILFGSMFNADRRRREVQIIARELRSDLPEALANNARGSAARSILSLRKDKSIGSEDLVVRARTIRVYEHLPLLARAFEIARSRILIISPWIRANVVDERFIGLLAAALDRGVQVTIGYGTGRRDTAERLPDRAAHDALVALTKSFKNFTFAPKGTTYARVLVVDTVFAVVTSFNWLSFKGDPNQPLKEEEGTLIEDDQSIETYFQKVKGRMQIELDL
jgi:phosphatidylserine/phosphatidylglycerophosphate/cardiolipin synthase-like enzyme